MSTHRSERPPQPTTPNTSLSNRPKSQTPGRSEPTKSPDPRRPEPPTQTTTADLSLSNRSKSPPHRPVHEKEEDEIAEITIVDISQSWEANPWRITMAVATELLPNTSDNDRERICIQTLKDIQKWLPERAVPRIFARLHSMKAVQSAQPNERKIVPENIQMQVAGIISTTTDDLSRISLIFWLSQLASTVDEYTGDGKSTVGRGRVSIIYDQYVEAEYATHEEYEQAKEDNEAQSVRKREWWKRKKEIGGKILRPTKEFGLGVIMCFPPGLTTTMIERMHVGQILLLQHGLKHGPERNNFRAVCNNATQWVSDFVSRPIRP